MRDFLLLKSCAPKTVTSSSTTRFDWISRAKRVAASLIGFLCPKREQGTAEALVALCRSNAMTGSFAELCAIADRIEVRCLLEAHAAEGGIAAVWQDFAWLGSSGKRGSDGVVVRGDHHNTAGPKKCCKSSKHDENNKALMPDDGYCLSRITSGLMLDHVSSKIDVVDDANPNID
jgi:hypothetical protein